nr:PREDICTED: vitrin isoform X2 [Latimeria chalumnae]|eukprot:XP_005993702.1 PREDICTED: vitrin isoform X2 [Latimeria chalumnae]
MNALPVAVTFLVLLLTYACGAKEGAQKNKKPKQNIPQITCEIKAGKISFPEFLAKCPPGCQEIRHPAYGTDIYASVSSICSAAIHSGIIDNAGGKILVRKFAGQTGYKGSFSNGIRSLSLPRWRESFTVAVGKPKKGVTYPSVLELVPSRSSTVKTGPKKTEQESKSAKNSEGLTGAASRTSAQDVQQKESRITPAPTTQQPTTTPPEPTTTTTTATTPKPTTQPTSTTTTTTSTATTIKPRPVVHKARDVARSRQIQATQGRGQNQALKSSSTYTSSKSPPRSNAGIRRQEPVVAYRRPTGAAANPAYSRVQQTNLDRSQQAVQANPSFTRRDWQSSNQRPDVQTEQRRQSGPSVVAPDAGYTWTEVDSYDTTVHSSRSSLSDFDRWILGLSPNNPRNTEPETNPRTGQEIRDSREGKAPEADAWKTGLESLDAGFNAREEPRLPEPVSQGDPNCKVDISFLIDGSWSIGKRRFQIQKQFLSSIAQTLDIGVLGPLMGIIQFGDDPSTELNLRTHTNNRDLKAAIEKIPQKGGLSNVGRALSYANRNFFSDANGNRGSAPNVVIVLVDGWPTDKVEEASRLARESGINIFFVTIEGADENEKKNLVEQNFVEKAVCRTSGYFSINVPSWFSLHKVVQPLVKRVCDTDRLVCSKTCLNSADIAFVIDGSSSVGTGNFRTILQFVANITKEFEISDTDTRIGAVQYTYEQRLEFAFDKHGTKQEVLNAIKRIGYWSGGTSTGAAITYASEHLFSKSKPNKRKIMIVITDGRSYDDVTVPATAAHQNGVIAYSIGIAWAAHDELEAIATDPDKEHSFFVDEFDNLYRFVPKIIQNICTEFNSQPRN